MNDAAEFPAVLARCFSCVRALPPELCKVLAQHYELLCRWNRTVNLTSVSGLEDSVIRHYCESLFLGLRLPAPAVSVLDVGSGAGFPGIPMALLRPDCGFTLAESHRRKAVFLREATRDLPNVTVAPRRAEEVVHGPGGGFGWVVSRAVKWPDVLRVARTAACGVGLLVGADDSAEICREAGWNWREAIPLPWGDRRVLLIGAPMA
jgi:16S rRNA (guanine527-N7)-methyltransferase